MKKIDEFPLTPSRKISNRYTVLSLLGAGYEGEVYKVFESYTNKERVTLF